MQHDRDATYYHRGRVFPKHLQTERGMSLGWEPAQRNVQSLRWASAQGTSPPLPSHSVGSRQGPQSIWWEPAQGTPVTVGSRHRAPQSIWWEPAQGPRSLAGAGTGHPSQSGGSRHMAPRSLSGAGTGHPSQSGRNRHRVSPQRWRKDFFRNKGPSINYATHEGEGEFLSSVTTVEGVLGTP